MVQTLTSTSEQSLPEQLSVDEACTTFLLTANSGPSSSSGSQASQVRAGGSSRRNSQSEHQDSQDPQSNWLIRVGLLLFGLILGYFTALAFKRRAP